MATTAPWPRSVGELEALQADLAERARAALPWIPSSDRPVRTAGVFAVFAIGHEVPGRAWAGAVVMEAGRVLATAGVRGWEEVPYLPGYLALQQGPLLEAAVRELEPTPDILLVNATGRDHPRRAGLALHPGGGARPHHGRRHRSSARCNGPRAWTRRGCHRAALDRR